MTAQDDNQEKKKKQHQVGAGGVSETAKEKLIFRESKQEKTPITEYTRNVDLEPEVEGWLEKVEKESSQLKAPIQDDTGKTIVDDAQKQDDFKVVLPMTKDEVEKGLHHKVIDSVRWLAEWCIRMVKMFGNKVKYRKEK